jgi:hypothetical protein
MEKQRRPVTFCTVCGHAGHNIALANARCVQTYGGKRCEGVNQSAIGEDDWMGMPIMQRDRLYTMQRRWMALCSRNPKRAAVSAKVLPRQPEISAPIKSKTREKRATPIHRAPPIPPLSSSVPQKSAYLHLQVMPQSTLPHSWAYSTGPEVQYLPT